ncbi:carboxypeptidase-like regulatory domain-containing protein [Thermus thermophilus]|uniref:carboxypeptidase-like regulatory domain-containing protein n=1 Tax=Thermus thermophilus TaxID=274 RepID=UPI001916B22D|nr:carboxypeptidase-like regulatory domain-containing protein [Thermus thermophilus]
MRPLLVGLLLLVSACALPPRLAEVQGALRLGPGGPPVSGAWVYLEGPSGAWGARTDGGGGFHLHVPPGDYRAWVEGEGLAGSEVRGLSLAPGPQLLGLVALSPFRPGWPRRPPLLEAEAGVEGGLLRYRARLFPQEGLSPLALLTGLGYVPGTLSVGVGEHLYLEETRDTGYRLLDPRGLSGATTLFLVGYDANNNRVELRLPLWLPGRAGQGGPRWAKAVAYTLSRRVEALGLQGGYSLLVRLSWEGGEGPFRIFRETEVGVQEVAYLPQGTTAFTDAGPGLRPGERVCYWVRGPETQAYTCTTPLPPLSVSISSPGEGEVTGPTPRLAWAVEGGGSGLSFAFQPVVWDQLTGGGLFLGVTQGTEVQPPPLLPGRPYTFELYLAYAVDDPENPRAYSVAADRQGSLSGIAVPGPSVNFEVRP